MNNDFRERDITQFGPAEEFPTLSAFEAGFTAQSEVFSIDLDGLPFDGRYRHGRTDTLFVLFSPALGHQPGRKLPIFSWVAHSRRNAGSSLILADPTILLSKRLSLAWYLGTGTTPLQPVMLRVIRKVAKAGGARRIVFVGTSGGGFPALWLAGQFPGAAAFVNAPTTQIARHHVRDAVQRFEKVAMGRRRITTGDWVLSLPDPAADHACSKIIITQNRDDRSFIDHHLRPYLRDRGIEWTGEDIVTDNLLVRLGDPGLWGQGHVMPPAPVTRAILDSLDFTEGDGFAGLDLPALHQRLVGMEAGD